VGSEALIAAIEAEGRERVAALLHEAEAEAETLRAEADAQARLVGEQTLALHERDLRADVHARIAVVSAETRRRVLEARAVLLERIFGLAREALPAALESGAAQAALASRAQAALEHAPVGAVEIMCSTNAIEAIQVALAGRDGVTLEHDPELAAGFRLSAAGGALIIDATLEQLLVQQRDRLAIALMHRIEDEATG
jgi:vacuolar-type H+-ATPase subunit E/Vma4